MINPSIQDNVQVESKYMILKAKGQGHEVSSWILFKDI